jgi:hypothetical protein
MKQPIPILILIMGSAFLSGCASSFPHTREGILLEGKPVQDFSYSISESHPGPESGPTGKGGARFVTVKARYDGGSNKHFLKIYEKGALIKECDENRPTILSRRRENGYNPERSVFPIFGSTDPGLGRIGPLSDSPGDVKDRNKEEYGMGYEIDCQAGYESDTLIIDSFDSKGAVSKYLLDGTLLRNRKAPTP